ncbi:LysE family translocator [Polaribacter undariae]|uniref:LysE family translocator n=1 Tax=Polaribacter sejongensis TaxID=985043 RepID=A0AAJ1QYP5_9FLAO|nr:LysE family translocator [Polaribacter undariae]MDN3620435.1 LysE family translocator [Polaribacter undariae]UWD33304.1 LysE family translocator [Polaribacter undariae]
MTETLISFVFATAILAFSPGPDNIFVLTQSIVNGTKYGIATVLGLMSGCLVHTSLVAFGVSAIIKENESFFFIIKLLGASYLLFLAFKVYKSDAKIVLSNSNIQKESVFQLFKKGFIMNVLNPKVALFFLAFFPQFLFSKTISNVIQFYTLGALFIAISFLVFSLIAILAGSISTYIKEHTKVGVYLKWGQIIVFTFIAIMILL